MAKKATASKKAAKPIAKPAGKSAAKKVANQPAKSKTSPVVKKAVKVAPKPVIKPVAKPAVKKTVVKPAKESQSKDQGDLLIEKAKEEMAKINSAKATAEKSAKVKPIKIERGNLADEKAKWQELFKRHGKDKASAYKMTDSFDAMKPIQHKILGWGFVLSNENNRLEVLFENGIKMLISNYKPS